MKSKIKIFLSYVGIIVFYIIFTIAVGFHSKLAYVLVLLAAILLLFLAWNDKTIFMKIVAIVLIIYSGLVLVGLNGMVLTERFEGNALLVLLIAAAEIFALNSSKIVLFFLLIAIVLRKTIMSGIRRGMANIIYGPLPDTQGMVKKDKKIYFYEDYSTKTVELIYRRGHIKKVLDTYPMGENFDYHYAFWWEDEKCILVRQYCKDNHKVVMEKTIDLPRR